MTWNEYKYWFVRTYGGQQYQNAGCGGPVLFAMVLLLFVLCSCKTQYVPVETVRTETKTVHDTIVKTDSINHEKETIIREGRPEDSLLLAKLGVRLCENERLVVMLQRELEQDRSKTYESHNKDSVRVEEKQVPYPVERKLTRWETFCIEYGKVMLGTSTALVIGVLLWFLIWIRRKRNR